MDSKNEKNDYWGWVEDLPIFFIVVMLFNTYFGANHSLYECLYLRGVFQTLRITYDYTLGYLPFPSVYLVFILLLWAIYRFFVGFKNLDWRARLFRVVRWIGFPYALFYLLWGYNYKDIGLTKRLELKKQDITESYLAEEIDLVIKNAHRFRSTVYSFPPDAENRLRVIQEDLLDRWEIPVAGRVRVRFLYPEGLLLRFSTAGIYIPYVMEGHIDAGLHPITWASTMAHEMAHGYGITDEGTCNFISYLTCIKTEVEAIQYSGSIMYLRYLLSNYRRYYLDCYAQVIAEMPLEIKQDLNAISEQHSKFPDLMPQTRDKVYDYYLKSNGVKDGLKSYSKIIQMVAAWKASDNNQDLQKLIED